MMSLLLGRDVEGRDTEQSQTTKKSQTTQTCPGGQDGAMGSPQKGACGHLRHLLLQGVSRGESRLQR